MRIREVATVHRKTNLNSVLLVLSVILVLSPPAAHAWGVAVAGGGKAAAAYDNILIDYDSYFKAWWAMEESADTARVDSKGANDLDEQSAGTVAQDSTHKEGDYAAGFGAPGNDYLGRADTADLSPANGFCFSLWLRLAAYPASGKLGVIVRNYKKNGTNGWVNAYVNDAGVLYCYFREGDGSQHGGVFTGALSTGTWYHVCLVADQTATKLYLYLNSSAHATTYSYDGTINADANDFLLGGYTDGAFNEWYLDGLIDAVGYWKDAVFADGAARQAFVTALYKLGAGRFFDGTNWTDADTTPTAFSFVDQTDKALSTVYASANVTLAGLDGWAQISVSGGNYSINGAAWTSSAGNVTNGDQIQGQVLSSANANTAANCTVTVGGVADTFTVTTYDTTLLAHFNGLDGNTTFTDSGDSPSCPHTLTAAGDAQLDTDQSKFGSSASLLLDGNGDYVTITDAADLDPGGGNWTFDCWFKASNLADHDYHFLLEASIAAGWPNDRIAVLLDDSDKPKAEVRVGGVIKCDIVAAAAIADTDWHHIAFVRDGSDYALYVDGTSVGTDSDGTALGAFDAWYIGYQTGSPSTYFTGWIEELRWSVGVARWTGNFTPPSSEY